MMFNLLLVIAFFGLLFGTYTDLKIREIPDWASYSLIVLGLGLRLVYSTITFNWMFFVYGLVGFGIFFGLACLMYYTGQWGGGDAKVLMGLGALFGFDLTPSSFLLSFFTNLLPIGALYGLVFSVYFAFKNKTKFLKEFNVQLDKSKKLKMLFMILSLVSVLFSFFFSELLMKASIILLALFIYLSFYLLVFVKSVENSSMYNIYSVDKLTEGDWIPKEIRYKGKYIVGPKDLGISKKQIDLLKKYKIKKVLVKEGIPFIPSFLITFIATCFFGNLMFLVFRV